MNWDNFPLSAFEVDCDGSACGSPNVQRHVHPVQDGGPAIARVTIRNRERVLYGPAQGNTRLLTLDEEGRPLP